MRHTTIIHILAILALPLLAPAQETGLPGLWKVVSITNLDTGGRQERPVTRPEQSNPGPPDTPLQESAQPG